MGQRILTLVTTGDIDMNNNYLDNVQAFSFYTEGLYPEVSGEQYIDLEIGQKLRVELEGNATLVFDPPPKGPCNFLLVVVQDATGSRIITWPDTVKWPSGVAPILSTAAGSIDIISFYYDGTNYFGQAAFGFAVPA